MSVYEFIAKLTEFLYNIGIQEWVISIIVAILEFLIDMLA